MSIRVHRCRFLDYERPYITALAFNYDSTKLASKAPADLRLSVCRSNGDIEIWNPFAWIPELVLPGSQGRPVEDVCWVKTPLPGYSNGVHRLFTVGGTDTITEWSLQTCLPADLVRSDAGVIWAIAPSADNTRLAAVTETGVLIVLDCTGKLEPLLRLSGSDASLTSLCWLSDSVIACGGVDGVIRVWSLNDRRILASMNVGRASEAGDDVVIWSLKPLTHSNQLVSADSNGFLKFWDAKKFLLQQSLKAHEGDVLCLAVSANGRSVFSAGLDQKIVHTQHVDKKSHLWTLMGSKVAHSHDVRCMASFEAANASILVSGGLDERVVVDRVSAFNAPSRKLSPARFRPHTECVENYVLDWNEQRLKLWELSLGKKKKSELEKPALKVVIRLANEEFITSASFDAELGLLAVSTLFSVKLFLVSGKSVTPLPPPQLGDSGAKIVKFVESERLVVVTEDDKLLVVNANDESVIDFGEEAGEESAHEDAKKASLPYLPGVALLANSASTLAVVKHDATISVYDLASLKLRGTLPHAPGLVTAAAFRDDDHLVVAYADKSVVEFDTHALALTPWSKINMSRMPLSLLDQTEPAYGVFVSATNPSRAWLWSPSWLATIDFASQVPLRKRTKRDHVQSTENEDDPEIVFEDGVVEDAKRSDALPHFSLTTKYKSMFFASNLGSDILVSERPREKNQNARLKPFWSFRKIQM